MEEYVCSMCGLVSSDPDDFETDLCCGSNKDLDDLICEECYDNIDANL